MDYSQDTAGRVIDGSNGTYFVSGSLSGTPPLLITGDANRTTLTATISGQGSNPAIILTGVNNYLLIQTIVPASSGGISIQGSDGRDEIFNAVAITGSVLLNGGDDYFQTNYNAATGDVFGGAGNDTLQTFQGSRGVSFFGEGGNDFLSGSTASDHLDGGADDDRLSGGEGNDTLIGGAGADRLEGGAGNDTLQGGGDEGDLAVFAGSYSDFTITMTNGAGIVSDKNLGDGDQGTDQLSGINLLRFTDRQIDLRLTSSSVTLSATEQQYVNTASLYAYTAVDIFGAGSTFENRALVAGTAVPHSIIKGGYSEGAVEGAILVQAPNSTIRNHEGAEIVALGNAVTYVRTTYTEGGTTYVARDAATLFNDGLIKSGEATAIEGMNELSLYNGRTGVIDGSFIGVELTNGSLSISNDGIIQGGYAAIWARSSFTLDNRGSVFGDIEAGTRQDRLTNSGAIVGEVHLKGGKLSNSGEVIGSIELDVYSIGYEGRSLAFADIQNSGKISGSITVTGESQFLAAPESPLVFTTSIVNNGTIGGDIVSNAALELQPGNVRPDASFVEELVNTGEITGSVVLGAGDDRVTNSGAIGSVSLGDGNDRYVGSLAGIVRSTVNGGLGDDEIDGGSARDVLEGGDGNDILRGHGGNDSLYGGAGDDQLYTGGGPQPSTTATWSSDNGSEYDVVDAGTGNDVISAGYGDTIDGGAGSDKLRLSLAGFGAGITFSTAGITSGAEVFIGGGSIKNVEDLDYLSGTQFADRLTLATQSSLLTVDAGAGNDVITATTSSTRVFGGMGNDRFVSGAAGDIFDGGSGSDTVDYSNFASGVSITLATDGSATGPGGDQLTSVENLTGSNFNDTLHGNNSDNILSGGAGDDTLGGGAGNDRLEAGNGNDSLRGGVGADVLIGGGGTDSFTGTASEHNGDTIADFTLGDRIVITDAVLSSFTYSLTGSTLIYSGGSLTFGTAIDRAIVASAAPEGGVQLTLSAPPPPPPTAPSSWTRLTLTEAGQDFTVGGNVAVIGTTAPGEVVRVTSGNILLDPSFSAGGDTLVLVGDASTYSAVRAGSTVTIYGGDTSVSIPVGSTGLTVQFADSTRTLRFDTQLGQAVLGTQQVTSTAVEVSASGPALAALVESGPASLGRLTLTQPGQDVEIGGNVSVTGTISGGEVITVRGGVVAFDPSFNTGGDMVVLPGSSGSYNGNVSGSSANLNNGVANVSIPVGSNGMVVMFDDRSAILRFDSVLGKVVLGDFIMSSKASPVVLAPAPAVSSSVAEGTMDASSDFHVDSLVHTSGAFNQMTTSGGLWFA